ncbi:hypothetical protein DER46DRAFT_507827, partial [Fusarium sp. MPI-SDFR-AT-0072]
NSLAKLPQELKDHIGRYLDLRSIARACLASNKFNFFLLSERAKLEKHTRAWGTVFGSVSDNKSLLNSVARLHGGRVDNWDIILLGSDLEYLYHADDVGKKLPQDYGPLHLWLRAIQQGFEGESFCVSSFYLDQVPGSTFRSTKVYGGMPREDPGSDGDSGLRKHLKETIGSLHRMARQNAIN